MLLLAVAGAVLACVIICRPGKDRTPEPVRRSAELVRIEGVSDLRIVTLPTGERVLVHPHGGLLLLPPVQPQVEGKP
jgi:hypothetical protein